MTHNAFLIICCLLKSHIYLFHFMYLFFVSCSPVPNHLRMSRGHVQYVYHLFIYLVKMHSYFLSRSHSLGPSSKEMSLWDALVAVTYFFMWSFFPSIGTDHLHKRYHRVVSHRVRDKFSVMTHQGSVGSIDEHCERLLITTASLSVAPLSLSLASCSI